MRAQQRFLTLHSTELLLTGFGLGASADRCVLIVPPFAEELNKCRRMMALQARALAAAGVACCYIDLSGTGDSARDFSDARWQDWCDELCATLGWLQDHYNYLRIDLLGIRLGAMLAAECAMAAEAPVGQLVFWQAVANGRQHLKQFLRTRVIAAALGSSERRETLKTLRENLSLNGQLEVAGYTLSDALAVAIEDRVLVSALQALQIPVHWLEVQGDPAAGVSPATQRLVADLSDVTTRAVTGEPFWSTTEIGVAPALIALTTAVLAGKS